MSKLVTGLEEYEKEDKDQTTQEVSVTFIKNKEN